MLLHYLEKLKFKTSNFLQILKKKQTFCIFIASTFVIHPQILIFSVFKIANLSPYWLQIKFSMSLFFYLFTLAINLWHRKFVTTDASLQCLLIINMILSDEDKILIKSLYLKGYTAKRWQTNFLKKNCTKRGVNKLFKKLWDTGTVNRRSDSGSTAQCPHGRKRAPGITSKARTY